MKKTKTFKEAVVKQMNESHPWSSIGQDGVEWAGKGPASVSRAPEIKQAGDPKPIYRQEDETPHKAPAIFPYPLQTIFEHLADLFVTSQSVHDLMKQAKNNPALEGAKKDLLEDLQKRVKEINVEISKISKEIEKIDLDF